MSPFNFYKADKAYGELYLQFPKVLLYSDTYSHLSDSAKLAYMLFKDRLHYSLKNNWIDQDDHVYFIFTNKELEMLFNKSNKTVVKIKKELEEVGLLLQKPQGFNVAKKKNEPNWLYLADLEVHATDIYQLQKQEKILESSGRVDSTPRPQKNPNAESLASDGCVFSTLRTKQGKPLESSGSVGTTHNLYPIHSKDSKESKDLTDTTLISQGFNPEKKDPLLEDQLMDDYIAENDFFFLYGEELISSFKTYSFSNFDTFTTYCNKLVYAKKSVEKEKGMYLSIHEGTRYSAFTWEELNRTFKRCIQKERFGKAENIAGYLFTSFKNVFESVVEPIQQDLPVEQR